MTKRDYLFLILASALIVISIWYTYVISKNCDGTVVRNIYNGLTCLPQ